MNTKKIIKIIAIVIILGAEVAGSLLLPLQKELRILLAIFLPFVTGCAIVVLPTLWKYPK